VRTCRSDREEFITLPRKQNGILADVPQQHLSGGDIGYRNTLREIGTGRVRLLLCHWTSPALQGQFCTYLSI
jgi:hypothetical protein